MRAGAPPPEHDLEAPGPASYQSAQELYRQGKYEEAADLFKRAASELKEPEKIAGAIYMVSLSRYRTENYTEAILEGRTLVDNHPNSQYVDDAMLVVAKSYSKKGSYQYAATYLVRLLTISKDSRLVPEAEKMLEGLAKESLNTQQLQKLASSFPDERFAPLFLYYAAKGELNAERRARAAATVRKLEELYAGSEYAARAAKTLGDLARAPLKKTIGLLVPMSGEFYVYGMAVERGVTLGLDTTMFNLVTYDSKGDPIEALMGARAMIEDDDVLAIIGPVLSMPTIAAGAIANTKEVVLISPTSTEGRISTIGPYIFQLNLSLQAQAEAIADFAVSKLGLFDLAVIYPEDAYGEGLAKVFKERVSADGGRVLMMKGYAQGTTDYRDEITAIKAAAPQGVFIPAYPDDIVLIAPQLRYYEFDGAVLGAGGWHSEKVTRLGEEYVEGAVFASVESAYTENNVTSEFERLYESVYGSKPSRHSALGYDAIQLVQNASRDPGTTSETLMERLSMVTSYRGSSGVISLARRDDGSSQAKIYTIHRGIFKQIE
jgi:branched-chain amino acid transport system substrate-binding protein